MLVLSKKEMQNSDLYTVSKIGIFEEILMENAGLAFSHELEKIAKKTDKIAIFCGSGNNGGDGIVLARRLKQMGFLAELVLVDGTEKFSKTTKYHYKIFCDCGFRSEVYCDNKFWLEEFDIVVDAIFGIGFHGLIRDEKLSKLIQKINSLKATIVSLDVPSGISADSGGFDVAVKANITLTVSYFKRSAFLFPAKLNYGRLVVVDADIECDEETKMFCAKTWGADDFVRTFVFPKSSDDKWSRGRALIVGGSKNLVGAVVLAVKACLQSGVGLVSVAMPDYLKFCVSSAVLEATYVDCEQNGDFLCDIDIKKGFDVVACGPGISRNNCVKSVVEKVINYPAPVVLDADALSFLDDKLFNVVKNRRFATILTPHVREMARLCGCDVAYVEDNRFELAKQKAEAWNCYLVLKGPNSIVTTPEGLQFVNLSGNEGLAKGGSGDVLTGIISAFVARNSSSGEVADAVKNAVFVHGACADLLVEEGFGRVAITASKVVETLSRVFAKFSC